MGQWDWIISAGIILFLILIIWSKIEQQHIRDTLEDIKEFIIGFKEDATPEGVIITN